MKTKAYVITLLLATFLISSTTLAQATYQMVEVAFMRPKIGMEKAFENVVKEHNNTYHKDGPYKGHLDLILTGKQAGWYAWIMGPCTFTDLDARPLSSAHEKHWEHKVTPTIAKYGSVEYWRHNEDLSYQSGTETPAIEEIWFIDLKRGDYYRFKTLITKIKEAFEKKGEGNMHIYNNQFNENNGRDIAIVWGMNNWAELDKEDASIKEVYEDINGKNSWQNAMDEWNEITEAIVRQLWKVGI